MSARHLLIALVLVVGGAGPLGAAQDGAAQDGAGPAAASAPLGPEPAASDGERATAAGADELDGRASTAVEIAVLLTVLSVLPALLMTLTCFTRIVIVLSFVRRSLSINELPPNPVIIGLALFLTIFIMTPVAERVYERAFAPYRAGALDLVEAKDVAWSELSGFLLANTRKSSLALFEELAGAPPQEAQEAPARMSVVVPAFVLSELKTAFQMGFLLFLPFLVIDLVVASVLLSMGMFMLPPVMISTPFKILLFVLVDGWQLVCQSLVTSFVTT